MKASLLSVESQGWKEHPIRVGDGAGEWPYQAGECQFVHFFKTLKGFSHSA